MDPVQSGRLWHLAMQQLVRNYRTYRETFSPRERAIEAVAFGAIAIYLAYSAYAKLASYFSGTTTPLPETPEKEAFLLVLASTRRLPRQLERPLAPAGSPYRPKSPHAGGASAQADDDPLPGFDELFWRGVRLLNGDFGQGMELLLQSDGLIAGFFNMLLRADAVRRAELFKKRDWMELVGVRDWIDLVSRIEPSDFRLGFHVRENLSDFPVLMKQTQDALAGGQFANAAGHIRDITILMGLVDPKARSADYNDMKQQLIALRSMQQGLYPVKEADYEFLVSNLNIPREELNGIDKQSFSIDHLKSLGRDHGINIKVITTVGPGVSISDRRLEGGEGAVTLYYSRFHGFSRSQGETSWPH